MQTKQIEQVLEEIQHNPLLRGGQPDTARWALEQPTAQLCSFAAGSTVYDPQHFQRSLGILLSGKLQVSKQTRQDKRVVMSHLMPGQLFGAAALFHQQPQYVTSIAALTKSRVLMLPEDLLFEMMRRDEQVMRNYLQYLSTRIYFLNHKIDALAQGSAEGRLAQHLLGLLPPAQDGDVTVSTSLGCAMSTLAQTLGISRASLYRAMESLEQQGLVQRQGKLITMIDPDALRLMMQDSRLQ